MGTNKSTPKNIKVEKDSRPTADSSLLNFLTEKSKTLKLQIIENALNQQGASGLANTIQLLIRNHLRTTFLELLSKQNINVAIFMMNLDSAWLYRLLQRTFEVHASLLDRYAEAYDTLLLQTLFNDLKWWGFSESINYFKVDQDHIGSLIKNHINESLHSLLEDWVTDKLADTSSFIFLKSVQPNQSQFNFRLKRIDSLSKERWSELSGEKYESYNHRTKYYFRIKNNFSYGLILWDSYAGLIYRAFNNNQARGENQDLQILTEKPTLISYAYVSNSLIVVGKRGILEFDTESLSIISSVMQNFTGAKQLHVDRRVKKIALVASNFIYVIAYSPVMKITKIINCSNPISSYYHTTSNTLFVLEPNNRVEMHVLDCRRGNCNPQICFLDHSPEKIIGVFRHFLITYSYDGVIRLVDPDTGRTFKSFESMQMAERVEYVQSKDILIVFKEMFVMVFLLERVISNDNDDACNPIAEFDRVEHIYISEDNALLGLHFTLINGTDRRAFLEVYTLENICLIRKVQLLPLDIDMANLNEELDELSVLYESGIQHCYSIKGYPLARFECNNQNTPHIDWPYENTITCHPLKRQVEVYLNSKDSSCNGNSSNMTAFYLAKLELGGSEIIIYHLPDLLATGHHVFDDRSISAITTTRDKSKLIVGLSTGDIYLFYSPFEAGCSKKLISHLSSVYQLEASDDFLISSAEGNYPSYTLKVCAQTLDARLYCNMTTSYNELVSYLRISPDESLVLIGLFGGGVEIWALDKSSFAEASLDSQNLSFEQILNSSICIGMLTGEHATLVLSWDYSKSDEKKRRAPENHFPYVIYAKYSEDSSWIFLRFSNGESFVLHLETKKFYMLDTYNYEDCEVLLAQFSAPVSLLAVVYTTGAIHVYSMPSAKHKISNLEPLYAIYTNCDCVSALRFSIDGKYCFVFSTDSQVEIWSLLDSLIASPYYKAPCQLMTDYKVDADRNVIATVTINGDITVYREDSNSEIGNKFNIYSQDDISLDIAILKEKGTIVASSSSGPKLTYLNPKTMESEVVDFNIRDFSIANALSKKYFAYVLKDNSVGLFNLLTREHEWLSDRILGDIYSIAFSDTGQTLYVDTNIGHKYELSVNSGVVTNIIRHSDSIQDLSVNTNHCTIDKRCTAVARHLSPSPFNLCDQNVFIQKYRERTLFCLSEPSTSWEQFRSENIHNIRNAALGQPFILKDNEVKISMQHSSDHADIGLSAYGKLNLTSMLAYCQLQIDTRTDASLLFKKYKPGIYVRSFDKVDSYNIVGYIDGIDLETYLFDAFD